jgi:hypothetical protein
VVNRFFQVLGQRGLEANSQVGLFFVADVFKRGFTTTSHCT